MLAVEDNADSWLILYCGLIHYVSKVKPSRITMAAQTFIYLENGLSGTSRPPQSRINYHAPPWTDTLALGGESRAYYQWLVRKYVLRHYPWTWGNVSFYPFQALG